MPETLLPIALATPAWSALSAAGGALIGSVSGGLSEAVLGSRRERRLAKAGARLVAGELQIADLIAKSADEERVWQVSYRTAIESWLGYREVLASRLDDDQFRDVSKAILAFTMVDIEMPLIEGFSEPGITSVRLEAGNDDFDWKEIRDCAAAAYNALAPLGGLQPVAERIHP
jgi:hypothetical protein